MANILVPTDFTPASLKLAEEAIKKTGESCPNIILFHAFELPDSPFDLLTSSYKEPYIKLMSEPFRQACKQLKDEYPKQVNKILIRCMNGNSKALFRNFAEANDIDLIYCPDHYVFSKVHDRSVDCISYFKKAGIPLLKEAGVRTEPVFRNQRVPEFSWLVSTNGM
ncbi:MAG: universal stress protein [Bacteroidota bacterium]